MTGRNNKDSTSTQLDQARQEHIRDLRVMVDQAGAREIELAGLVKLAMEEKFYRPTVTRAGENKIQPVIPADELQDVTAFDQAADQKAITEHEELGRKLEHEFQELVKEEDEYRKDRVIL